MKKIGFSFLVSMLIVFVSSMIFISCSRSNKSQDDFSELVVWHTEEAGSKDFMTGLVKRFEAQNKDGVDVNLAHYSVKDIVQQYQNASIAGTGPAIIFGSIRYGWSV